MINSMPVRLSLAAPIAAQPHSTPRAHRSLTTLLLALLLAGPVACTRNTQTPDLTGAAHAQIAAPWDDVAAAMQGVMRRHEMAIVRTTDPAPHVRVYELITITDNPVAIRFTAPSAPASDDPARHPPLDVAVRVGLWGDRPAEERLILTIRERLEALAQNRRSRAR